MNTLIDDLIITCRTTCGCGNKLIPYTKEIETTHYLLTCDPYSDVYNHPLLIAIDMNSPVFIKARKWDNLRDDVSGNYPEFEQNQKLRELAEKLPFGLILQHIRDSFSEDKQLMSVEAQMKTTKCIESLMELQKQLEKSKT